MKVITEAILRDELRASHPETYTVPEGKLLSPAAREYLNQLKIKIVMEKSGSAQKRHASPEVKEPLPKQKIEIKATEVPGIPESAAEEPGKSCSKPKYVDDATGAFFYEKPEHMTQLVGNVLVNKDDKRIVFRGKLDSLEALFVLTQTELVEMGEDREFVTDLEDILVSLREMMRCDVLGEPYTRDVMIGLSHAELREHSHHPMKYYKVKQMVLPSYTLGRTYALLNRLRTAVRETEVAAAAAFHNGKAYEREDIVEELNRMSSAMHIIMCKYLAKLQNQEA